MTAGELQTDTLTDHQLLVRYRTAKDEAAFGLLVRRHQPMVPGVCYQTLGNRHDAEDACQATFLVLAKGARKIRKTKTLANWLYGVAYRVSLRLRRGRTRSLTFELEEHAVNSSEASPLDRLAERYQHGVAHEELSQLPDRLRTPLVLRYLSGLSNKEVAARMGLSEAAVEGRLKRAKSKLRMRLTRHGLTLALSLAAFEAGRSTAVSGETDTLLGQTIDRCLSADSRSGVHSNETHDITVLAQQEIVAMTTANAIKAAAYGGIAICAAALSLSVHQFGSSALASDPFGDGQVETRVEAPFGDLRSDATRRNVRISTDDPFDEGGGDADLVGAISNVDAAADDPFAGGGDDPFAAGAGDAAVPALKTFDLKLRSLSEQKIEHALRQKTRVEFLDQSLAEVVAFIEEIHGIQIVIDERALEELGVSKDVSISIELSNIGLRSVLNIMLRQVDLDYMVKDEVLIITSPEEAESNQETRLYPHDSKWGVQPQQLVELITTCVHPSSWAEVGGEGFISSYNSGLIVRQSYRAHVEISELLEQFSEVAKASDER